MGEKLKLDIGLAIAWMSLQVRHNTLITDLRANQRKGVVSSVNDQRRLKIESNGGVFIPKRCEYYISNMGKTLTHQ